MLVFELIVRWLTCKLRRQVVWDQGCGVRLVSFNWLWNSEEEGIQRGSCSPLNTGDKCQQKLKHEEHSSHTVRLTSGNYQLPSRNNGLSFRRQITSTNLSYFNTIWTYQNCTALPPHLKGKCFATIVTFDSDLEMIRSAGINQCLCGLPYLVTPGWKQKRNQNKVRVSSCNKKQTSWVYCDMCFFFFSSCTSSALA